MKKLVVALCFIFPTIVSAQFSYRLDETVAVEVDGVALQSPWIGGLNTAQFNSMDLDMDGDNDLVIYDRMGGKIVTFLNDNGAYAYFPEYESFFPPLISNWVLLRDIDNDGRKDLFTGDVLGIRVYKNISDTQGIKWELFPFFNGSARSEVLITKGLSGKINLQMQFDDLPSIGDADGDGDLDIFCMDYGGSGRVEFHKNFSVERYGVPDSLDFELITKSWGGFAECDCAEFAFNNEDCGSSGGRTKHSGGKSLLAFDANGDSKLDMLLSEAECDKLSFLQNSATLESPVITDAVLYPATPANFLLFPTPYLEDVDNDGINDLIVTPNIASKTDLGVDLRSSVWFYKNTGSNNLPNFNLIQKDFLQERMLDLGDNAVPTLGDVEGDGDLDLFVSSNVFPGRVTFFRNEGTATSPKFVQQDEDYLSLSQYGFRNLKIQLVDVNQDNKIDLALYGIPLNSISPRLYTLTNTSSNGLDFAGAAPLQVDFALSTQENITLTDVSGDGKPDILKGKNNGSLEYWRNTGNMAFTLENAQYLNIGPDIFATNPIPFVADLNLDGKPDLLLSDHRGFISIVSDYRNAAGKEVAVTDIVFNNLTEQFYAANLGGRIWPAVGNIFGGKSPSILAGTSLGGLRILRPEEETNASPYFEIYPNPISATEVLKIRADRDAVMEIYSVNGQKVGEGYTLARGVLTNFNVTHLPQSVYILRFLTGNKSYAKRLVVH